MTMTVVIPLGWCDGDHHHPSNPMPPSVTQEHKFLIVETLRRGGNKTGMTGDGVNDGEPLVAVAAYGATYTSDSVLHTKAVPRSERRRRINGRDMVLP
jgi:hypothetical protein